MGVSGLYQPIVTTACSYQIECKQLTARIEQLPLAPTDCLYHPQPPPPTPTLPNPPPNPHPTPQHPPNRLKLFTTPTVTLVPRQILNPVLALRSGKKILLPTT